MNLGLDRILEKVHFQGRKLNAPVSERAVQHFEAAHGIQLPDGYREFLKRVGNGGEGPPCHGLGPLGLPASDMCPEQARRWVELRDVHKPFPFTRYWIWDLGQETDEGTQEQVDFGSIYIGNDGCGAYWHLIKPACPKRDFLTWYEDWLDGKDSFYAFPY